MKIVVRSLAAASVSLAALATSAAFADVSVGNPKQITDNNGGPLHWQAHSVNYGDHRDSTVKVLVRSNGEIQVHFVWSNGNRVWGEDYLSRVKFYDADGVEFEGLRCSGSTALNGTGPGKTQKDTHDCAHVMSPEEYRELAFYTVEQYTTDPNHLEDTVYFGKVVAATAACYYGNCQYLATAVRK